MKLFAFHLLNDYSGSPKVLRQAIKGFQHAGIEVTIVTSKGRTGFLSDLPGARYTYFTYRWAANPWVRLINLWWSQLALMVKVWPRLQAKDVVYVNTVLPFGAALLGWLKGCRVVYHLHETSMKPVMLKKFLFGIMKLTADDVIYVSTYLSAQEPVEKPRTHIVYNAIEDDFFRQASQYLSGAFQSPRNRVLMVCSLKDYKGIYEYVALARRLPEYQFTLVVNAGEKEVAAFTTQAEVPANFKVYPTQVNLHPFYQQADVVLNLSRPDKWVETFGLTAIEAMAYGLPVIVPPVGGIAELVEYGQNGYRCDSRNGDDLVQCLHRILAYDEIYNHMKQEALKRIALFRESYFVSRITTIVSHT